MADIDIVVTWVDGGDPDWLAERARYQDASEGDSRSIRFRDWDTLRYWFRGVEKFAPWVRTIHFVTWGHVPAWLDTDAAGLHIVRHDEFIPEKYLPTFSSHPIEWNLHRIEGLAEQFVYFNDDTFLVGPSPESYWFRDGLPCDQAIIGPYVPSFRNSIAGIVGNDMEIINTRFKRSEVMRQAPLHWFNPKYGKWNLYNLAALMWGDFTGIMYSHFPNAYLRETFETLWQEEPDILDATCRRRFRDKRDVNQWLARYWQLCSNRFVPRKQKNSLYLPLGETADVLRRAILSGNCGILCLNDCDWVEDFEAQKAAVHAAFDTLLPGRSRFEK